jgi:hypothetical protein
MSTITPAAVYAVSGSNATITGSNYNTTPSYSGTFIPTLWSSKMNAKFYAASVYAAISNSDWEGEISGMGDKVIINNIPTITISNYTIGSELTYPTPTPNTMELVIDKGKVFTFTLSDVLNYQAQPNLMETFSNDASEQMRVAIDADILLQIFANATTGFVAASATQGGSTPSSVNAGTAAGARSGGFNLGSDLAPVSLTGANVLQKILELASVLDEQNVPESDRWLVIDPLTRTLLLQSNLAQAQFMGDPTSPVRNGMIGKIDRFTVYVSNQMPFALAGKDYLAANLTNALKRRAIFAGHKSAICFASQMTKTENLRNPKDFGDLVRGLQVYGYKLTKPEAFAVLQAQ